MPWQHADALGLGQRNRPGQIAHVEDQLYRTIDQQLSGHHLDQTLAGLRALAAAFPAGQAVQRRAQTTNPNHTEQGSTP
jgi:hypothetical protein